MLTDEQYKSWSMMVELSEQALRDRDEARAELAAMRDSLKRMHRRAQKAEARTNEVEGKLESWRNDCLATRQLYRDADADLAAANAKLEAVRKILAILDGKGD